MSNEEENKKLQEELQEAKNILTEIKDIENKYQKTLKLEEINKIHDNLDKKNTQMLTVLLRIANFFCEKVEK